MATKSPGELLDAIAEMSADDLLTAPAAELREEILAAGLDPDEVLAELQAVLDRSYGPMSEFARLNEEWGQKKEEADNARRACEEVQKQRDQVAWAILVAAQPFRAAVWRVADETTMLCEDRAFLAHFEKLFPSMSVLGDDWNFDDHFALSRLQDGEVQLMFYETDNLSRFVQDHQLKVELGWCLEQHIESAEHALKELRERYRVLLEAVGKELIDD